MASTTVAQLAAELNRSAAVLLEQLQSAGVSKASTDDALTEIAGVGEEEAKALIMKAREHWFTA